MKIHDFYLRVKTSVGTIHLPVVHESVHGDTMELVFNWIVFEEDVTVCSFQPFADVEGTEKYEAHAVGEEITLTPGDGMHVVPAGGVGCFTPQVPMARIRELDPEYTPDETWR